MSLFDNVALNWYALTAFGGIANNPQISVVYNRRQFFFPFSRTVVWLSLYSKIRASESRENQLGFSILHLSIIHSLSCSSRRWGVDLLKMQMVRPQSRPTESETLMVESNNPCFNKLLVVLTPDKVWKPQAQKNKRLTVINILR